MRFHPHASLFSDSLVRTPRKVASQAQSDMRFEFHFYRDRADSKYCGVCTRSLSHTFFKCLCYDRAGKAVLKEDRDGILTSRASGRGPRGIPPEILFIAGLHVAAGLDAASLRPLPDVRDSALLVSGVEEATVEGASRVVAALQPPNGYDWLLFPGALTYESSLLHLLANLRRKGVRVKGRVAASPSIGGGTEGRVKDLVRRELGCDFRCK
ncbi:hypothetical protein C7M84_014460 [Penaeus vannamei]|uniref:Uncharacterized protein n=1 Tax=Penaeus vannamei TaxID=6689 RepID=A0A3R7M565_PENVA|nr:hypothetical protein C7M84_014460 [Penaeus vannamei]